MGGAGGNFGGRWQLDLGAQERPPRSDTSLKHAVPPCRGWRGEKGSISTAEGKPAQTFWSQCNNNTLCSSDTMLPEQ